jgi:hypothetical protein
LNVMEISDLSHFVGAAARTSREEAQRRFWLPRVAATVEEFAQRAETLLAESLHSRWLDRSFSFPVADQPDEPDLEGAGVGASDAGSALPSPVFEKTLDSLVYSLQEGGGFLFVLRNQLPAAVLPPSLVRKRAGYLHHSDDRITRYALGVRNRRAALEQEHTRERLVMIVPYTWQDDLLEELSGVHADQSETPGSQLPDVLTPVEAVQGVRRTLRALGARAFRGERRTTRLPVDRQFKEMFHVGRPWLNTLPDCWIYFSRDCATAAAGHTNPSLRELLDHFGTWLGSQMEQHHSLEHEARNHPEFAVRSRSNFEELLRRGDLRIVKVSGAKYNPRYRGSEVTAPRDALKVLMHLDLALRHSIDIENEDA